MKWLSRVRSKALSKARHDMPCAEAVPGHPLSRSAAGDITVMPIAITPSVTQAEATALRAKLESVVETHTPTKRSAIPALKPCTSPPDRNGLDSGYASAEGSPGDSDARSKSPPSDPAQDKDAWGDTVKGQTLKCGASAWTIQSLRPVDKIIPKRTMERFYVLLDIYSPALVKLVRQKYKGRAPVHISLMSLSDGAVDQTWVVVACDYIVQKTVKAFFEENLCRHEFQPVEADDGNTAFGIFLGPPLTMLASWAASVYLSQTQSARCPLQTLCGNEIRIRRGPGDTALATIGGTLQADFAHRIAYYRMTVGHVVDYPELGVEGASDCGVDSGTLLEVPKDVESRGSSLDLDIVSSIGEIQVPPMSFFDSRPCLDWALIEVAESTSAIGAENFFRDRAHPSQVRYLHDVASSTSSSCEEDRPVFVASNEHQQDGVLLPSLSRMLIGPGACFSSVYSLKLTGSKTLGSGVCGTWVVDAVNGTIYGHIVAEDAFGRICVVPLDQSLRQMQDYLASETVRLPHNFSSTYQDAEVRRQEDTRRSDTSLRHDKAETRRVEAEMRPKDPDARKNASDMHSVPEAQHRGSLNRGDFDAESGPETETPVNYWADHGESFELSWRETKAWEPVSSLTNPNNVYSGHESPRLAQWAYMPPSLMSYQTSTAFPVYEPPRMETQVCESTSFSPRVRQSGTDSGYATKDNSPFSNQQSGTDSGYATNNNSPCYNQDH